MGHVTVFVVFLLYIHLRESSLVSLVDTKISVEKV